MKKSAGVLILVLLVSVLLQGSYVGKVYFKSPPGQTSPLTFRVPASFLDSRSLYDHPFGKVGKRGDPIADKADDGQLTELHAYFESEMRKGNLRLRLVQDDPEAAMEHRRYTQRYKNLEVFGGEIIEHYKEGRCVGINGEFFDILDFDITPFITKDQAVELFKTELSKANLAEKTEGSRLLIYPIKDGDYRLAYHIVLREGAGYSMTGIIDAKSGEVLLKFSNVIPDDLTIGLGIGYHGNSYKFPTTFMDDFYLLYDNRNVRPVTLATYDYRTYDGRYYYLGRDADNYWDYDGALVNAHAYLGLTYDYFYLVHSRNGIDANNMDIDATVHWYDSNIGYDNAYWDGDERWIFFLDPGKRNVQMAAALDAVAHEYSHGVTQFTSNLVYFWESGALNEAFSDIIGAAVEFYWQPIGNGFNKAEWVIGEDEKSNFSTIGCRNLADPNSNSQMKNAGFPRSLWYPDPCHLSQEMPIIYYYGSLVDSGGVHINSTIYSHAFYLLANGGTNKVSKVAVNGIGIEKATEIFYRAWTYYMVPSSDFLFAANALLQSAYDLGPASNEYAQTIKAMEAIGWIVK